MADQGVVFIKRLEEIFRVHAPSQNPVHFLKPVHHKIGIDLCALYVPMAQKIKDAIEESLDQIDEGHWSYYT